MKDWKVGDEVEVRMMGKIVKMELEKDQQNKEVLTYKVQSGTDYTRICFVRDTNLMPLPEER